MPAEFAASVGEGGLAQDHIEGWINKQLAKDVTMQGLYPPSSKIREAYERWVATGEPDE